MFALALRLGRTVAELLYTLSSEELSEWIAFHRLSPIDDQRGDLQAGLIASVIANAHRSPQSRPFTPSDFMPYVEKVSVHPNEAFIAAARKQLSVVTIHRHGRAT